MVRSTIVLLLLPSALLADEASKGAKIEDLLKVTNADSMMSQIIGQMSKQMDSMNEAIARQYKIPPEVQPRMAELSKRLTALMLDQMNWDKMRPLLVKIYADVFTEDEIEGLIAFYRSPAGKAYVEKTPMVMQKMMEVMQTRIPEITTQIQKMTEDFANENKLQPAKP